jgi:hypothetical protein
MARVKRTDATTHQVEVLDIPPDQVLPDDEVIQETVAEQATKPWEDVEQSEVAKGVEEAVTKVADEVITKTVPEPFQAIAEKAVEMVVVYAKAKFSVGLPEGNYHHVEAGESVIPRSVAEHWYAKSNGLKIVGKVDENSINSALSVKKLEVIEANLSDIVPNLAALEGITDFTEEQKEHLQDLFSFAKNALDSFTAFKAELGS